MKYLSNILVTAREVPRGWRIVFGVVPHFRAWNVAYALAGLVAGGALEAALYVPGPHRAGCAVLGIGGAVFAASILIGLRRSALRRGRERLGVPRASLADLWHHADEERAARLVELLRRTCDVEQASRWVGEQLRRRATSRLSPPQWLISSFLLPISAGVSLAATKFGWQGVLVGMGAAVLVLTLWVLATSMSLLSLEPLHDLAHLLNLASIRGDTPPAISPADEHGGDRSWFDWLPPSGREGTRSP